jgi:uncharacterized protein
MTGATSARRSTLTDGSTVTSTPVTGRPLYFAARETHSAIVLFMGDLAYKVKKPVDLGFLDFRTEPARLAVCHREVDLNRRLAPDVYLGVADVTGPDGDVCDHLVVMRRMPDDRRLSTLVRQHAAVEHDVRRVAHMVAAFHARSERSALISEQGSRDALRGRWVATFDQLRPFHGGVLAPEVAVDVERLTLRYLEGRDPLFASRIERGFVVDGHADLLTDDIFCLPDGPRILDCLEFDDQLRFLDGLDDAAFLGMDLERLGAPELAAKFLGWYVEYAGDPAPPSLLHHYLAYRAYVRAKVACLRAAQGDAAAVDEAGEHADLAHRHLATAAVTLVLVGGLPGTGKSTLAGALADELGMAVLGSDRLRKELAGLSPESHAPAPYHSGLYAPAWTERTYAELLTRAEKLLALGESVVLDASWSDQRWRDAATAVAERAQADLVALRCVAPPELAAERLSSRSGISDADESIAAAMRADTDPWPDASEVDTTTSVVDTVRHAAAQVRPKPARRPWLPRRPQLEPD